MPAGGQACVGSMYIVDICVCCVWLVGWLVGWLSLSLSHCLFVFVCGSLVVMYEGFRLLFVARLILCEVSGALVA